MEFVKNSLILIGGFVLIGLLIEGLRYPGFALFMAYVFYFLTMYGLVYDQYKNYKKDGFIQHDGTHLINIFVILLAIFAYYYFGIMLYDETVSYINNK